LEHRVIDLIVKTHKENISELSLLSAIAHLLHHNRCFFPTNMVLKIYLIAKQTPRCAPESKPGT